VACAATGLAGERGKLSDLGLVQMERQMLLPTVIEPA